jgi:hypothetical protein
MRHVDATIDGRLRHAGDRYTLINQTPRPAAVASEMGHNRTPTPSSRDTGLIGATATTVGQPQGPAPFCCLIARWERICARVLTKGRAKHICVAGADNLSRFERLTH